jgi:hypothetical protein
MGCYQPLNPRLFFLCSSPLKLSFKPFCQGSPESFKVASRDDVDRMYAKLSDLGHAGSQPPYDTSRGCTTYDREDADDNHIGFMSASDLARRRPPRDRWIRSCVSLDL